MQNSVLEQATILANLATPGAAIALMHDPASATHPCEWFPANHDIPFALLHLALCVLDHLTISFRENWGGKGLRPPPPLSF